MQTGTVVADRYRVARVIGRGGMGFVVEAVHLKLDTKVAIKFLDPDMLRDRTALARFTREAKATAQLKSEHVCRVIDFGVDGNLPYLAMELLDGADLAQVIKQRPLQPAVAADYMIQACSALAEAHAAGIVHRDLKPGNLFLTKRADGSPLIKVLDFGVAKTHDDTAALTATKHVVGSTGFMSPEQFRSSKTVDFRSDIWALGVILYRLVSRRLPFKADSVAEFALALVRDPAPPLPESPELEPIVKRCLEKDPANRYPDVAALAAALRPIVANAPPRRDTPNPDAPRPKATLLGAGPASEATMPVATSRGVPAAPAVAQPLAPGELAPGTVVGEYVIERKIGEGGMGAVYAAVHPLISKKAAIKVIAASLGAEPEAVQRFMQEARAVNQIGHPNIVDVFAFGNLPDGRNYFVMEHLHGESLRELISRPSVPLGEGLQILDEVAAALEAAHENGIVHRDLKPDNVYLAQIRPGVVTVKLLDFGIAKLAVADPTSSSGSGVVKTKTGMLMGTPAYLSPEQARGKNVDHRTDIYALGCIAYEIACARMPFIAPSAMDIVLKHLTEAPTPVRAFRAGIPASLDAIILRMMEKDPAARPTIAEVRTVFAQLVGSGEVVIEHTSGITIRSDLRGPRTNETPSRVRARSPRPSESQTNVHVPQFTPAPTTPATPAPVPGPARRSRRGLMIGIGAIVVGAIGGVIAFTQLNADHEAPPPPKSAPAPVAALHNPAPPAPVAADAPPAPPAPPPTTEIRVNVANARIELDGAVVQPEGSTATVPISPGPHHLIVTAPGKQPFDKTVELAATPLEIRLDARKGVATRRPPHGPTKDGTGSGQSHDGNYTLDPFAQ